MTDQPRRIAILGAGPAGLALALRLLRRDDLNVKVVVYEMKPYVGGIAASFETDGLYLDQGSHRLHPATSPEIMGDIRALLGDDLMERPRHGRISLLGRFVKFPLNPLNLVTHLPPSFIFGFGWDLLSKPIRKKHNPPASFAEALQDGLGSTICNEFYFPYARKLWGLPPEEISVIQAQKRVSADSIGKLVRKVLSLVPGFKTEGAGIFYYPRKGYGQISDAMAEEVRRLGGEVRLSTRIHQIVRQDDGRIQLHATPITGGDHEEDGTTTPMATVPDAPGQTLDADFVFSTIPITVLAKLLVPAPPPDVMEATSKLGYRAMVLHYLILETDHFTEYDAHYFPGLEVPFSRTFENKNYSAATEPKGLTGVGFELPCALGDDLWTASDEEVTRRVCDGMKKVGLPINVPIKRAFSRRIPQVYPTYNQGFERHLDVVDQHLTQLPNLVPLGRQALFAHDNTHHTMEMAYRASDCLGGDLTWDAAAWQQHRAAFEEHVVVD